MYSTLKDFKSKGRKNVMFDVSGTTAADIKLPTKFGFQENTKKTSMVFSIKPEKI